jgi:hypothetical protein
MYDIPADLVNLILNSGLVQKQAAAWDTWVLGTATANSSGSTATVKLDGDSTAVTLPTSGWSPAR